MDFWKLLLRKIKTLIRLSTKETILLSQGLILFPLVTCSLNLWGLKSTQRWLTHLPQSLGQSQSGSTLNRAVQTARMIRVAARYCQPWAKCLQQSVVLWGLLYHQGISSHLRIGVNRDNGQFNAHAWVEFQGFALNEQEDVHQQFSVLNNPIEVKR